MTRGQRRLTTWLLLLLLIGGSVYWSFTIPYQPRQIYRGIPGSASLVLTHDRLAERWDDILDNPAGVSLLTVLGVDLETLRDPSIKPLLNLFAEDKVAVAFVPELGFLSEPAWVFSSWMGGKAIALRWSKKIIQRVGLIPLPSHSGWPVWMTEEVFDDRGTRFMFALADGVAVGVLSRDPAAIEEALAAYNGYYPSVFHRPDLQPMIDEALASEQPDRGWLIPRLLGLDAAWPAWLSFNLSLDREERFSAAAHYPMDEMPPREIDPVAWSPVRPRLAATSVGYAVASPTLTDAFLTRSLPQPWMAPFRPLLVGGDGPLVAAAAGILTDEFSGRFKGIKLPTLLVAARIRDGVDPSTLLADLIDRVNGYYQWQLVPRYERVGDVTVAVLESGGASLYSALGRQEYPSVAILDSWLVLGSNFKGLRTWLTGLDPAMVDVSAVPDGPDPLLGLWFDLAEGGKAIRLALSAWSLKLMLESPVDSGPAREKISEIKAWIDTLVPLETLTLTIEQHGGYAAYALTAGQTETEGDPRP